MTNEMTHFIQEAIDRIADGIRGQWTVRDEAFLKGIISDGLQPLRGVEIENFEAIERERDLLKDNQATDWIENLANELSSEFISYEEAKTQISDAYAAHCQSLANYEAELKQAAAILQEALPIGQVRAIGLREVATGAEVLAGDLKRAQATIANLRERLAAAEAMLAGASCFLFDAVGDSDNDSAVEIHKVIGDVEEQDFWTVMHCNFGYVNKRFVNCREAYEHCKAAGWLKPQPQAAEVEQ